MELVRALFSPSDQIALSNIWQTGTPWAPEPRRTLMDLLIFAYSGPLADSEPDPPVTRGPGPSATVRSGP